MALEWITVVFQGERFEASELLLELEQRPGGRAVVEWAEEAFADPDFGGQLVERAERRLWSFAGTSPLVDLHRECLLEALELLYQAEDGGSMEEAGPPMAPPGRPLRNSPLAERAVAL